MISIVIGYRNRDLKRIVNSIESIARQFNNNFELIFVNYGSDFVYQETVSDYLKKFSFVKYIYSDTRGKYWNRAHALNIGANDARGDKLLFSDIDLVFPSNYFELISKLDCSNTYYTFQCYYLDREFTNYSMSSDLLKNSTINYVGLCLVSKKNWESVNGYNEYFMYWGAEDDDFYKRMNQLEIINELVRVTDYPVVHQWHPQQKMSKPTSWYLEMVYSLYSFKSIISENKKVIINNVSSLTERNLIPPFLSIEFKEIELFPDKLYQFNIFLEEFFKLDSRCYGKFRYVFPLQNKISKKAQLINYLNAILKCANLGYEIKKIENITSFYSYELWAEFVMYFVGKSRTYLEDYFIEVNDKEAIFYFQKC